MIDAGPSKLTVTRLCRCGDYRVQATEIRGSGETLWKIQTALEAAGIEFISADELKGPGVRFRRSGSDKPKEKKRGRT